MAKLEMREVIPAGRRHIGCLYERLQGRGILALNRAGDALHAGMPGHHFLPGRFIGKNIV